MKNYLFTAILFLAISKVNAMCLPEGLNNDSREEFIVAVSQSLASLKEGHTILMIDIPVKKNQTTTDLFTDLLVNMKTANQKYECAAEYLTRFKSSKNEIISTASQSMIIAISTLVKSNRSSQVDLKNLLDDAGKVSPSQKADKDANTRMESKEAWEIIANAATITTHLIPDEKNPKVSAISENIRKKALNIIQSSFKKNELQKPKEWIDLSASALNKVLNLKFGSNK